MAVINWDLIFTAYVGYAIWIVGSSIGTIIACIISDEDNRREIVNFVMVGLMCLPFFMFVYTNIDVLFPTELVDGTGFYSTASTFPRLSELHGWGWLLMAFVSPLVMTMMNRIRYRMMDDIRSE